jgi:predicted CXXCH cytochrome family protein
MKCHAPMAKQLEGQKSVHGAVAAGDCTKCHSPHKAAMPKLLLAKAPDLCFSCHKKTKERLAAETRHAPVDDCGTCHRPHSSSEPRLATQPMHALCGDCHDTAGASFSGKHLGIAAKDMHCMSCHEPHSSKDPKLFKPTVHPPFAARTCDACHSAGIKQ